MNFKATVHDLMTALINLEASANLTISTYANANKPEDHRLALVRLQQGTKQARLALVCAQADLEQEPSDARPNG